MQVKSGLSKPQTLSVAELLLRPFQEFVHAEVSSGVLLLVCTIVALLWANAPWPQSYHDWWEHHVVVGFADLQLDLGLHQWINDGLMALFFLLIGLEIKREMLVGELSQLQQAILPIMAAVGGVLFPALIYLAFTWRTSASMGWGMAMATDIAFALGALTLLGKRVPFALKVVLAALAIADDLIAVLTIALFYSTSLNWLALAAAGGCFCSLLLCNLMGVRRLLIYALLGLLLWLAVFQSGVHATIAGVLLAVTIPVRSRIDAQTFVRQSREMLAAFEQGRAPGVGLVMDDRQQAAVQALQTGVEAIQAPLQRMEHGLHVPVSFVVIPLFVLANAGVSLTTSMLATALLSPVSLGVCLGLVFGKQAGITLFSWVVVKLKWAQLPESVTWRHLYGMSWLGGIGFTMSLFIANLAFATRASTLLDQAKVGILLALLLASLGGAVVLLRAGKRNKGEREKTM